MTPEEFDALQEIENRLAEIPAILPETNIWDKLDAIRRVGRREWMAQPEEKRAKKQESQSALHEAFIQVGIDLENPREIALVMLGVGMCWQVQEITSKGCPDAAHVLEHVADGATRLVMALEEHAQRLGVRNAAPHKPEADDAN